MRKLIPRMSNSTPKKRPNNHNGDVGLLRIKMPVISSRIPDLKIHPHPESGFIWKAWMKREIPPIMRKTASSQVNPLHLLMGI